MTQFSDDREPELPADWYPDMYLDQDPETLDGAAEEELEDAADPFASLAQDDD